MKELSTCVPWGSHRSSDVISCILPLARRSERIERLRFIRLGREIQLLLLANSSKLPPPTFMCKELPGCPHAHWNRSLNSSSVILGMQVATGRGVRAPPSSTFSSWKCLLWTLFPPGSLAINTCGLFWYKKMVVLAFDCVIYYHTTVSLHSLTLDPNPFKCATSAPNALLRADSNAPVVCV